MTGARTLPLLAVLLLAAPAYAEDVLPAPPNGNAPAPAFIAQPAPSPSADNSKATPGPTGPLFGGGKGDTIDITADQGLEWHENERTYIARGHATAKRGDVTVTADTLRAFDRKKPDGSSEVWRVTADGNVTVATQGRTAYGDQATYDIDSKRAVLTGQNLRYVTPTDVVTAEKTLEFWENENKAVATGHATATREDRRIIADTLTVYFGKDAKGNQTTDRLEAQGSVHVVTKDSVVFCDNAIYHPQNDTAELMGNVNITQKSNQLKGDRVEANFKTGVSKLLADKSHRVHALIVTSGKVGPKSGLGSKDKATPPTPALP